ncbi:MAG: TonB-dependent receptor [Bacteroidota bacterium]
MGRKYVALNLARCIGLPMLWLCVFLLPPSFAAAQSDALDRQVTVSCYRESLGSLMKRLEEAYQLPFTFNDERVARLLQRKVSFQLENVTYRQVLDRMFQDSQLQYRLIGGSIVLRLTAEAAARIPKPIPTQTMRGKVRDWDTHQPLIGAKIVLQGNGPLRGGYSDEEGNFSMPNVPVGRYNLLVSYLGYEQAERYGVLIGAGKQTVLLLELKESAIDAEKVVISPGRSVNEPRSHMIAVSAHHATGQESERYAGSFGDVSRMANGFPGILNGDDMRNDLVIRGNSPRGVMYRLEGIEIPNPNHFAKEGTSSGSISMLSPNMLQDVDVLTGAFPAQYGNAFSGVVDMHLRTGNDSVQEYAVQLGNLGGELSLEGPFKQLKGASYLINLRGKGSPGNVPVYPPRLDFQAYQDLSFKFHLPFSTGAVDIFGLGGWSNYRLKTDSTFTRFRRNMNVYGLSFGTTVGTRTFVKAIATVSRDNTVDTIRNVSILEDARREQNFRQNNLRMNLMIHHKFSARSQAEFGMITDVMAYSYKERRAVDEGQGISFQHFPLLDSAFRVGMHYYLSWQYHLADRFKLTTGLHTRTHTINGKGAWEPRIGVNWRVLPRHNVKLGLGYHSRLLPLSYHLAEAPDTLGKVNQTLPFPKALHYVLGYHANLTPFLHLDLEGYYQYLYEIPVSLDSVNSYFSTLIQGEDYVFDDLLARGEGRNLGVDLSLRRFLHQGYYWSLSASIYDAKYRDGSGQYRNSPYNARYSLHGLAGKEFYLGKGKGKPAILGINARFFTRGGYYYTPIDLSASIQQGEEIRQWEVPYSSQLPAYTRFDMQLYYRRDYRKFSGEWRLDIQNISQVNNTLAVNFDPTSLSISNLAQFGRFLVLSYRIEFSLRE